MNKSPLRASFARIYKPFLKSRNLYNLRFFSVSLVFFSAYCASFGQDSPREAAQELSRIHFINPQTVIVGTIYRHTSGADAYILVESALGGARYPVAIVRTIETARMVDVTVRIVTTDQQEILGRLAAHDGKGLSIRLVDQVAPLVFPWGSIQRIEYFFPEK